MQKLVNSTRMGRAGTIIAEELGEFLDCDEEELQVLIDGKSNPDYWDVYENLNPYTLDDRILIINDDAVWITETDEEFKRYSKVID